MPHIHFVVIVFLSLAALVASTIDTIAGGGGLITVPALLMTGMPPALALGTNKFQACFGSGTATARFLKHGNIKPVEALYGVFWTFFGASLGTLAILTIHHHFLRLAIPILLFCVLIYSVFSPKLGEIDKHPRMNVWLFFFIFGIVLGFYDGFLGPGTGSFWVVALVYFLGFNIKKATMHAKIYNFTSNVFSLLWFLVHGQVLIVVGIGMAIGQFIGAWIGSHLVIKKPPSWIRPIFISMVVVMLIGSVIQQWRYF